MRLNIVVKAVELLLLLLLKEDDEEKETKKRLGGGGGCVCERNVRIDLTQFSFVPQKRDKIKFRRHSVR